MCANCHTANTFCNKLCKCFADRIRVSEKKEREKKHHIASKDIFRTTGTVVSITQQSRKSFIMLKEVLCVQ